MNKKLPVFILIILGSILFKDILSAFFQKAESVIENNTAGVTGPIKTVVVSEESATINVVKVASPAVVSVIRKDTYFNYSSGPIQQEDSIGTGFIIDGKRGIVLTNKHVVDSEEASYSVYLDETDKQYDVVKVARDPVNDFSVLQVRLGENEVLPELKLADSDSLQIGQTVIAIGNALGEFGNSVTRGIISGLNRGIMASSGVFGNPEYIEDVIQTDAALNPGNSGGPLINLQGEVIGINVAISGGAENIGFSIPVNSIKPAIAQFNSTGKISRAYLGVQYRAITADLSRLRDIPEGVYVEDVVRNSPADKAGVQSGDIIIKIDGAAVTEENTLAKIISRKTIGDRITLTVYRDEQEETLRATLEDSEQ